MLFIAIQSANRVHQHWEEKKTQKRPNNFDCDCVLEEFWECEYSMGLLAGNVGYVHMSSTVSRTGKKTFHGRTQSEHEIKCLYFIITHISRFSGENICNVGRFWGMPNSCLELFSSLAKRGKKYISLLQKRTSLRTSSLLVILRFFVLVKRNSVSCAAEYLTRGIHRWWEFVGRFSPYRAQFPRKSNELLLTAPTVLPNWSSRKYSEGMVTCLSGHHYGSRTLPGLYYDPFSKNNWIKKS